MPTPADWYAPGASTKVAAQFAVNDAGEAEIVCADGRRHRAEWREVTVSPRLARLPRRLEFPDGGWAEVADNDAVDRALLRDRSRPRPFAARAARVLHFFERRLWTAVLLLGVAAAVGITVVRVGIPAAADFAAARLPGDAVAQIGDDFYQRLRDIGWLRASRLSAAEWTRAYQVFDAVAADLTGNNHGGDAFHYRLRLHDFSFDDDGDDDGDDGDNGDAGESMSIANALAFPSGLVVFTDELVTRLDDAQLAAVAAHEIGHVRGRHTLRMLIQSASVLTLFGLLIGDVSGLTLAPLALAQLQYSRDFETEADCFAYRYMAAKGIAWETFGEALARIEVDESTVDSTTVTRDHGHEQHRDRDRDQDGIAARLLELLSTHPPSAARADPAAHCPAN
ncbi:MAG: M48 family metallopeptidase [Gammaproteobacteria bacterium]|nr:M48 family metallopeptidase [Gammaproteobacteria bacterium]